MAINATRGLPSFSEMLQAFRNKGSLGQTLQAGLAGYEKGVGMAAAEKKAVSDQKLQGAQTEEALAKAETLRSGGAKKRVPLAALPESIKASLAPYVDSEGMVPEEAAKVALGTTDQGRKAEQATETLKVQQQMLDEKNRANQEREALVAELTRVREESGAAQRELAAARGVAEAAGKVDAPSLLNRGVSLVKEGVTGDPTAAVLAERQRQAATAKMSELSGITPGQPMTPAPMSAKPKIQPKNPARQMAIDELTKAGAPITEANITEAIRQLGQQQGQ